jgi:peroxiredoxin Q/BCP
MSKQSRRPARAARHQEQNAKAPKGWRPSRSLYWIVGVLVVAGLFGASFLTGGKSSSASATPPLTVGGIAPAVSGRDVVSGRTISAKDLAGKDVLYYLNEGVMCQACLAQIQVLQQHVAHLAGRHLTLVSVTNDDASTLAQAAADYKITTPLLSDTSRAITKGFGVLGGIPAGVGMHANTADHTFVLVDKTGHVRFIKDYPKMWVDVNDLLRQLPKVA